MSDLPKCRICKCNYVSRPFANDYVFACSNNGCFMSAHEFTYAEWAALMGRGEPVATYDAEALAYELCLEECSEENAHQLLWEGHPPEPWGEVWQRYIPDAERMIERVKKHMTAQAPAVDDAVLRDAARYRWLRNESWAGYNTSKRKPEVAETVVITRDCIGHVKTILAEEALDAAIDAAIKGEG